MIKSAVEPGEERKQVSSGTAGFRQSVACPLTPFRKVTDEREGDGDEREVDPSSEQEVFETLDIRRFVVLARSVEVVLSAVVEVVVRV